MNLGDIQARYSQTSARASEIARQLAFAGIAVVWLFSGGEVNDKTGLQISRDLLWPGALLVASLALDFLHATYAAGAHGVLGRVLEKSPDITSDTAVDYPRFFHWPSIVFFWAKLASVGAAYGLLASYFFKALSS